MENKFFVAAIFLIFGIFMVTSPSLSLTGIYAAEGEDSNDGGGGDSGDSGGGSNDNDGGGGGEEDKKESNDGGGNEQSNSQQENEGGTQQEDKQEQEQVNDEPKEDNMDVGSQNTASQIQGDENGVSTAATQEDYVNDKLTDNQLPKIGEKPWKGTAPDEVCDVSHNCVGPGVTPGGEKGCHGLYCAGDIPKEPKLKPIPKFNFRCSHTKEGCDPETNKTIY